MSFSTHPLPAKSRGGFALISVLALVSLAALTATAFLASARLERQATLPLGNALRLEWALTAGEMAAQQTINDATEPAEGTAKNFVATLWRGTNTEDWTKETGYLLIGEPNSTNSVRWTYYAGFSPAGLTNLTTNSIESALRFTNSHQGTYFSESSAFFDRATNGFTDNPTPTNPICTTIALLGGQTSPPVGWVYLTQRMRQKNSTNTSDVTSPVARVAWFIEDLSGKIDAEQMGGLSSSRLTGTNPEEICLTSMFRTNGSQILPSLTTFTNLTNRKLFFTPGLLAKSSISGLTNSDDLRYFATGLREFRPNDGDDNGALDWIPCGIPVATAGNSRNPYRHAGFSKLNLNQLIRLPAPSNVESIAAFININLPDFARDRRGGFDREAYNQVLAANIIDYADTNSFPTTNQINGVNIVGYDSYPMLTHVYDAFLYRSNTRTITHTTWMQFWNPSTQRSRVTNVTVTFTNNDTVRYTNPAGAILTNILYQTRESTTNLTLPRLSPNCGFVARFVRPDIDLGNNLPDFPTPGPAVIYLNTQANTNNDAAPCTNSFSYTFGGATITPAMTIKRQNSALANGVPAYCAGFLAGNQYIAGTAVAGTRLPIHDPRMTPYLGRGTGNQYAQTAYDTTYWRGYVSQQSANLISFGDPAYWPDGASRPVASFGTPMSPSESPARGSFTNAESAPCKISDSGSYTNICELGNIFDPIQWAPPTGVTNFANADINTTWTNNNLFGGGSTLRIGRPEHSRLAFTQFGGQGNPIPNMGRSAAALLDLFCVSDQDSGGGPFRTGGKININTAPYPVLAALAGGINLTRDTNGLGSTTNTNMINSFATGVMKFRQLYPFLTPSQLLFISRNYGDPDWTNSSSWSNNAVFSTGSGGGLSGVTSLNDEGREEWFTKIYNLSTVQSDNYRAYIVAQLVDSNRTPISPVMRKYVQFFGRPNNPNDARTNEVYGVPMYYWTLTKGLKKAYESPY
jgi:hypothetical protein